jgi:DHA1 family bicyclomycin/chloramphenicol resistance-like MFS transporter
MNASQSTPSAPPTLLEEDLRPKLNGPLLITLAMLAAVSPFSADLCLPAFPRIAAEFGVGATGVQLCITSVLLGGAVGQLVFGPISDRFGRVKPLIIGLLLSVVAIALAAMAPTLHFLIVAQFVVGFGGVTGMVLGRAIITDLAKDRSHAARANNIVTAVFGIAPIVAPWFGSLLAGPIGWRGILWAFLGFVLLTFAAVLMFVRESNPPSRRAANLAASEQAGESPRKALRSLGYIGNTIIFCLTFAILMSFVAASPFLFQTVLGLSVLQYGRVYAMIALVAALAAAASAHLAYKVSPGRQMGISTSLMFLGSLALLALLLGGAPAFWILAPMILAEACVGFTLGNAAAAAVTSVPRAAGVGSALLGALQYVAGAVVAPMVGLRGASSVMPLAAMMLFCSALAAVTYRLTWKKEQTA